MSTQLFDEDSSENIIDISNTSDWFSFKKNEQTSQDPFSIGLEDLKK